MQKITELLFKRVNILYLYGVIAILILVSLTMTTLFITKKKVITKTVTLVSNEEKKENIETVKVDVKGNVINPGVYELEKGRRVIDGIDIAGGLKENSNTELINLSKKLTDEMTIIIYTNKEIEDYRKNNVQKEYIYIEVEKCPDKINDACINKTSNDNKTSTESVNKIVSINTASVSELESLPGIGTNKAKEIINYRDTNGHFNAIEDIKNVNGIGDTLFEKIKDHITI